MKYTFKIFSLALAASLFLWSCNDSYIDPITEVSSDADKSAPEVKIQFPVEGTKIKVLEAITSIDIKFEITDDVEIKDIKVNLNGSEIASFTEFKDYRRYLGEFTYDQIPNGVHELSITATDLQGQSTTETVTFEKEAPYQAIYDGEVFYMPFDNDFIDLVSITRPTVVGNPTFAEEGLVGAAYKGAPNSHLEFPAEGLKNDEFSAVFWMKVNASPDRAGILVMGPPDPANPDNENNRNGGFRFFRENAAGNQRFKLNVGRGDGNDWFDGGEAADVDPTVEDWNHFAFTISNEKAVVYLNGQIAKEGEFVGIDWTNVDVLSIMSGAPNFVGWNHRSDESLMDELRIFDKVLSQEEIQTIIETESGRTVSSYTPKYEGETFYLPFDGEYVEQVSGKELTVVGSPSFAEAGIEKQAYAGAADSYLTFPTDGLLGEEFSAVFWYKPNTDPARAGLLVVGPPDEDNPDAQNKRTSGFRFFREGNEMSQIFKLNVGKGDGETWFDGGAEATIDPTTGDWVHLAFTISSTESVVYIDGEVAKQGEFEGVDWTNCDMISIASGAPRFVGWNHRSDQGNIDEMRLFNRALSQEGVQQIISDEQ